MVHFSCVKRRFYFEQQIYYTISEVSNDECNKANAEEFIHIGK